MPRAPRPARLRLEPLEPRDTPALLGLENADIGVATGAGQDEQRPQVAVRPDGGGFVVVWEAPDGGGSTGGNGDRGIFFQRYNASWQKVGAATAVNTFTTDTQDHASVGIDAAGNFVIAWESFDQFSGTSVYDIYARRYDATGAALDAAEFRVNTTTAGAQHDPDVAVNAAGQFVVTWWGGTPFAEDVFARGYAGITAGGSGTPATTFGETTVNNTAASTDDQIYQAVAIDGAGNFVVAYQSYDQDGGTTLGGPDYGIYVRRMAASGVALSGEFKANTVVNGNQQFPDVAIDGTGAFTVVWESPNVDGSGTAVVMQRYTAAGAAAGANTTVNATTAGAQGHPRVARTAAGDTVVTWTGAEAGGGTGTDIFYRVYDAAGAAQTGETRVNAGTGADPTGRDNSAVAADGVGGFVVAFEAAPGATGDVFLRRFGASPTVAFADAGDAKAEAVAARDYTVTRTAAGYVIANVGTAVTVTYAGGTADAADFTNPFPQTLTFNPGDAALTRTVTVSDDTTVEPDETILQAITAGTDFALGSPAARTITIVNDDTAVSVAVSPAEVGEDTGTPLAYTFTRRGVTAGPLAVSFTIGGSGTFGTDYTVTGADAGLTAAGGTVTIPAGATTATVLVHPTADAALEPDVDVTLTATAGAGYTLDPATAATGTILDDDTTVSVAVSPGAVAEDAGTPVVYTFTRNGLATAARTISFAAGGTAAFGSDYTVTGAAAFSATAGTVLFAAGSTTATVTVHPTADAVYEADETVRLTVVAGAGYSLGTPTTATATVTNDDAPPTLAVGDATASEGAGTITFTVTRTGATELPITVDYATADDSAVSTGSGLGVPDFTAATGTLTIPAGTATKTFTVALTNDATHEDAERFFVNLSGATGATIADAQGIGTITDDDPLPTLSVGNVTQAEGNGGTTTFTFTVSLSAASALPVTVRGDTADGTATAAGGDYDAVVNRTLTFAPGVTSLPFAVVVRGDTTTEADEQFTVVLSAASGATIPAGIGTGTITNDDAPPAVTLALAGSPVAEAGGVATVTATLSNPSAVPVAVALAFTGTAAPGRYAASAGTITVPAGSLTGSITLTGVNDARDENPETVVVDVAGVTNGTEAGTQQVTATLADDDLPAAAADAYATAQDAPLSVAAPGLLGNDAAAAGSTAVPVGPGPAHGTLSAITTGGFTYTPAAGYSGPDSFQYRVANPAGESSNTVTVSLTVAPPPAAPRTPLVVGGQPGGAAALYAPAAGGRYTASPVAAPSPFGPLGANVRTASGDVNGDHVPDLILVTGPGTLMQVAVVDGRDNATVLVAPFVPFDGFTAGGFVAAADFRGTGRDQIVVSPDRAGGPRVSIFELIPGSGLVREGNYFSLDPDFRGGVRTAAGDLNGDHVPDLVIAAGYGGGPRVSVIDGRHALDTDGFNPAHRLINDFYAFDPALRDGGYPAVGDVDGDGIGDLILGPGDGGPLQVVVVSGKRLLADGAVAAFANPLARFTPTGLGPDGSGARVAAVYVDGDTRADIAVGPGRDRTGLVKVYPGAAVGGTAEPGGGQLLDPFGGVFLTDGVFVG